MTLTKMVRILRVPALGVTFACGIEGDILFGNIPNHPSSPHGKFTESMSMHGSYVFITVQEKELLIAVCVIGFIAFFISALLIVIVNEADKKAAALQL